MNYRGQRENKGTEAEDLDPKVALLEELTKASKKPPKLPVNPRSIDLGEDIAGKVGQPEANYTKDGEYPFQCGNCLYWLLGLETGLCQLVDGEVSEKGSCRFWSARPIYIKQVQDA